MIVANEMWFQLTILLGIAVASHFIVTRFGQPLVIAEIIIGILIGPSILGIITNIDLISQFAQLGAIFLLFAIGLECNLNEIYTKKSLIIASFGVIVPWIAGFIFGMWIGQGVVVSVFIGAIIVATSVAVTAEILVEMGQLDKPVGKAIIGAAVVDDILGMIVLTMSLGVSSNSISVLPIIMLVVAAGLFIIVGAYIGSKYLGRIILFIEKQTTKVEYSSFIFALAVMFLYAFIAERIGMSAIIGAFVAGTMFSSVKIKKELQDGAKILTTVFAPIFFISIGLMVNFRILAGHELYVFMVFGLIFTIIAMVTKIIGCGIPAKAMGMSNRESLIVGYGMSPRCEVALIIAMLGLTAGIIGQNIYFMAVFMAILTTVLTPPFLKVLLKEQRKMTKKGELIAALSARKKKSF